MAKSLKGGEVGTNTGNGRRWVVPPADYPGKRYIKDKSAPNGRYAYAYQVEAWKQTGRIADPKKEIVHHTREPYDDKKFSAEEDRHVAIESRKDHYTHGHGRPFSRPGGRKPKGRGM
jgi:hypothetical protein